MKSPKPKSVKKTVWVRAKPTAPLNAWYPDDDDAVVRRTLAGDARADIARALGRTVQAIESRQALLRASGRLPRQADRSWSVTDDALLAELRAAGVSDSEVARRLGRSEGAVWTRVNRLMRAGVAVGRSRGDFRWKPDTVDAIARLARAGGTPAEIAAAVGRSVGSVSAKLRDLRTEGRLPPLEPAGDADDRYQPDRVRYPQAGADPLLAALFAAHGRA